MTKIRRLCFATGSLALALSLLPVTADAAETVTSPPTDTYQVLTTEVEAHLPDGTSTDVYRFDPGVFVARQGDTVVLKIHGVKGQSHPVVLEGYDVQGVVEKNQTLTLQIHADKPGLHRLVCTAHADMAHGGPMEGYLFVIPTGTASK